MMATRVKVCCIHSRAEAAMAIDAGASAVGLVSSMPSGPGVIEEALIAEIAASVPPPVATFLLTSRVDAEGIVAQLRRCGANTIQLCDRVPLPAYPTLRRELPGVSLVQVVHVGDHGAVDEALEVSVHVDAVLLDSGNPSLPVKELGGTGRVHDWSLSAEIVAQSSVPVFLAGGLRADNVAEAIRQARPFAVDLCSGVRTDGALDADKLAAFMQSVVSGSSG